MALWHLIGSIDETKKIIKTPVTDFPFTIGRNKSLDMVVLHSGISREHAEIYKKGNRLYIRDLDSTNGTFVNKHRISSDMLVTHDTTIHLAHVAFKLIDSDYKSQSDQHLTRIIKIADAPKIKDKEPKNISPRKSLDSAKILNKTKETKESKSIDADNVNANHRIQSQVSNTNTITPSTYSLPSYLANEKIFVRGGSADSNRRLHIRREAHWPAQVVLNNQQLVQCMTKDFSEKGLALMSPINLQVSALTRVEVNVFYKGQNLKISFIGVVKHSLITAGGFSIGIQIKNCTRDCSEFIKKFSNHQI